LRHTKLKIDHEDIKIIFAKIFPDQVTDKKFLDLKMSDIEKWDSLGNFNFLLEIEEFYDFQFDMEQLASLNSIETILEYLERR